MLGAFALAIPLLALSAGILWTGRDVWPDLNLDHLRTLIFLTLIISSQASIYLARTRGHAWRARPGSTMLVASLIDIAIAAILALTGTLMPALTPAVVGAVIGTILIGAGLVDLLKVPAFRVLGIHTI
jgi:H+-transporting ATPase